MTAAPLGSHGVLILIGVYLAWAGGAFAIVYSDIGRRPRFRRPGEEEPSWGLAQWGGLSLVAGGLVLPFYFSSTRGAGGLGKGIGLGIAVAIFALGVRVGLSMLLRVPIL